MWHVALKTSTCTTAHPRSLPTSWRTTTASSPWGFFSPDLSLGAVTPLSWKSLFYHKKFYFCCVYIFFLFFLSGQLSKKWFVCASLFLLLSSLSFPVPTARAPLVLFQPHYTLHLHHTFHFCSVSLKSVSVQQLSPWTLKTDTWSYLNLFSFCNTSVFLCALAFSSYIVHNKYIIIMLTGCLC